MSEIRIQKIDGQEFVPLKDYLRLKEENKKLKEMSGKLGEMNGKLGEWVNNLEEENKKLKYVIDLVMEKAGIEYIRLADGDVFTNPKNKLHISDTI